MQSMEMTLQQNMCAIKVHFKGKVTESIMKDEGILFNWLMIVEYGKCEEVETLFKMITR